MNKDDIHNLFNDNLFPCDCIDCLVQQITIRKLGKNEITYIIEKNIVSLKRNDYLTKKEYFIKSTNDVVNDIINSDKLSDDDVSKFIYDDDNGILPVPVVSNKSPSNTLHILTHIIISLGYYETEIDALCHNTFQECFRNVGLIGYETDKCFLKKYSSQITTKYIEQQFSPPLIH